MNAKFIWLTVFAVVLGGSLASQTSLFDGFGGKPSLPASGSGDTGAGDTGSTTIGAGDTGAGDTGAGDTGAGENIAETAGAGTQSAGSGQAVTQAPADNGAPDASDAGEQTAAGELPDLAAADNTKSASEDAPAAEPNMDLVRVEPSGDALISGRSEPNAIVALLDNGEVVGKTVANEAGDWVVVLEKPLEPGGHDISVDSQANEDAAPVKSKQRATVVVNEDRSSEPLVVVTDPEKPSELVSVPDAARVAAEQPDAADPQAGTPDTASADADTLPATSETAGSAIAGSDMPPADSDGSGETGATGETQVATSNDTSEPQTPATGDTAASTQPATRPEGDRLAEAVDETARQPAEQAAATDTPEPSAGTATTADVGEETTTPDRTPVADAGTGVPTPAGDTTSAPAVAPDTTGAAQPAGNNDVAVAENDGGAKQPAAAATSGAAQQTASADVLPDTPAANDDGSAAAQAPSTDASTAAGTAAGQAATAEANGRSSPATVAPDVDTGRASGPETGADSGTDVATADVATADSPAAPAPAENTRAQAPSDGSAVVIADKSAAGGTETTATGEQPRIVADGPGEGTPAAEENAAVAPETEGSRLVKDAAEEANEPYVHLRSLSIRAGKLLVAGNAAPASQIRLRIDSAEAATLTANADGEWAFETADEVAVGPHVIEAAVMRNGLAVVTVRDSVVRTPNPLVTVEAVEVEGDRVYVAGASLPNAVVRVYVDNEFLGETRAKETGRWILEARRSFSPGEYQIRADQVEGGEGKVLARAAVPFERIADDPVLLPVLTAGGAEATGADGTDAGGRLVAPNRVIIREGDNLWRISRRLYGRGIRFSTIYKANAQEIQDPDLIFPGQIFVLPEQDEFWDEDPVKEWERVRG